VVFAQPNALSRVDIFPELTRNRRFFGMWVPGIEIGGLGNPFLFFWVVFGHGIDI
jgi:hypothetical protein